MILRSALPRQPKSPGSCRRSERTGGPHSAVRIGEHVHLDERRQPFRVTQLIVGYKLFDALKNGIASPFIPVCLRRI